MEFETAARRIYTETVARVRELRPKAQIGFFHMSAYYSDIAAERADDLAWLWDMSDASFPTLYVPWPAVAEGPRTKHQAPPQRYHSRTARMLALEHRMMKGKPVLPFIRPRYHPGNEAHGDEYLNEIDLRASFEAPLAEGAAGVVIWDSLMTPGEAAAWERYLASHLGPMIREFAAGDAGGHDGGR